MTYNLYVPDILDQLCSKYLPYVLKNALNSIFDQATNLDPISSLAKDKQKLFQYIYVLLTPSQHLDTTLFLAFTNILVPYTESITKVQENQTSNTLFLAFTNILVPYT